MRESLGLSPIVPMSKIGCIGDDLNRPECVLSEPDGSLYVSHREGGVSRITPGGKTTLIGQKGLQAGGSEIIPNGIHRNPDGSFLIANIGEGGGIWQLSAGGELTPHLMEVDGVSLSAANFVTVDSQNRTWITVSTVSTPRFKAYSDTVKDGLIIVQDEKGARIVSDSICFANECRLSPENNQLYISETLSRSITRFDVSGSGELSNRQTFAEFGYGDFPDGCCFDAFGHLWVACIVSNRLYRISPEGQISLIIEDAVPAHLDWVETALAEGRMGREHFYETAGEKLKNIASVAIGGPQNRQVYMGSLAGTEIATFAMPESLASA